MRGHAKDTLLFIVIAVCLMWLADYLFMGGREAYQALRGPSPVTTQSEPAPLIIPSDLSPVPEEDVSLVPSDSFDDFDFFNDEEYWWGVPEEPVAAIPPPMPPISIPPLQTGLRPRIAIIIDDIGMNAPLSRAAIDLPAAMTMAVLPYAAQAADFAQAAIAKGHDVLIHTPMEAMSAPVSLGGMGLTTDMGEAEVIAMIELISRTMEGYIGINNHMGSKFTADRAAMERLMPYLKQRGLIFVDSRTIGTSVAGQVAAEQGVPTASRDVFLDHEETSEFVHRALAQAERIARRKGYAIAIGHPKSVTVAALAEWIPTLEAKGIDLVPISVLVTGNN